MSGIVMKETLWEMTLTPEKICMETNMYMIRRRVNMDIGTSMMAPLKKIVAICTHVIIPIVGELTGSTESLNSSFIQRLLVNAVALWLLYMSSRYLNADRSKETRKHPQLYSAITFVVTIVAWSIISTLLRLAVSPIEGLLEATMLSTPLFMATGFLKEIVALAIGYWISRGLTRLLGLH